MNSITREDLQAFITTVEHLAHAVMTIAGQGAVKDLIEEAERLKVQLDKDETII